MDVAAAGFYRNGLAGARYLKALGSAGRPRTGDGLAQAIEVEGRWRCHIVDTRLGREHDRRLAFGAGQRTGRGAIESCGGGRNGERYRVACKRHTHGAALRDGRFLGVAQIRQGLVMESACIELVAAEHAGNSIDGQGAHDHDHHDELNQGEPLLCPAAAWWWGLLGRQISVEHHRGQLKKNRAGTARLS